MKKLFKNKVFLIFFIFLVVILISLCGYLIHINSKSSPDENSTISVDNAELSSQEKDESTEPAAETSSEIPITSNEEVDAEKPAVTDKESSTIAHNHSYTETVVSPTCTDKGYTLHTCSCGDSYKNAYISKLGHNYSEWVITAEATSSASGSKERTCSRCGYLQTESIPKLAVSISSLQQDIFRLVNEERAKNGRSAYQYCYAAQQAADKRAEEEAGENNPDHYRPNGNICFDIFDELGYSSTMEMYGENIVWGYSTPQQAMDWWMNSPIHRFNILNDTGDVNGIVVGVAKRGNSYIWVQIFVDF